MEKQLQLQDDAALVQDYVNGNERALEMLIKRHKLRIYNFIYSKVFDLFYMLVFKKAFSIF